MHVFGVVWSTCGPVRWTPPAPYNCIIGQLLLNYTHARLWCGAVYLRASAVNPEDFHHGRQEVRGAATRRTTLRSAQTETKTDLQGASDQSACNQKPRQMRRAQRMSTTVRSVGVQPENETGRIGCCIGCLHMTVSQDWRAGPFTTAGHETIPGTPDHGKSHHGGGQTQ